MGELIVFPSGDEAVWSFLDAEMQTTGSGFEGVHAAGLIPNPRPAKLVRVRLGGGTEVDLVTALPTVYVECYATKVQDAKALSLFCHYRLLRASRDGQLGAYFTRGIDVVSRPQDLPDPLTEQARFTATYAVRLRGTAA